MNDSDFLAEILANPHDDVPRLVYADWLEEQGNPRGEFIRIQCELDAGVEDEDERNDLRVREMDLLDEFGEEWAGPVPEMVTRHVFLRGFVEYVVMPMAEFVKQAPELIRLAPIRHVMLNCRRASDAEPLANCVQLEQMNGLILAGVAPDSVRQIFGRRSFPHLEKLVLGQNRIGDEAVRSLANAPGLENLKMLDLCRDALRNSAAIALAESPYIKRLETLLLSHNEIRLTGARALANSPNFDHLKHLDFSHNPFNQQVVDLLRDRFGTWGCEV